jgi:hypothetical protein
MIERKGEKLAGELRWWRVEVSGMYAHERSVYRVKIRVNCRRELCMRKNHTAKPFSPPYSVLFLPRPSYSYGLSVYFPLSKSPLTSQVWMEILLLEICISTFQASQQTTGGVLIGQVSVGGG